MCSIRLIRLVPLERVEGIAGGIEFMIVDIPKDLHIPVVSSPPTSIPKWTTRVKTFLPIVFDFGSSLVHDNGVNLLFHKDNI